MLRGLAALAFACGLSLAAENNDSPLKPQPGETLLAADKAQKVLADIAERFKASPAVKARVVTESDDELLGRRKTEGELLLDRSGRVLRKFTKPASTQVLDGDTFQEYLPKLKKLFVKDFSKAPRALRLLRAALTADLKLLSEVFEINVFEAAKGDARAFRIVLLRKADANQPLPYTRIQGRIRSGALFYSEIEYLPEGSTPVLERYLDVEAIDAPKAEAFALEVPAGVTRQVDVVGGEGRSK
jgi:hypothetical protein